MSAAKAPAETVFKWLRDNLPKNVLGVLTSTDAKALQAAVQIVELYAYHSEPKVIENAFAQVVRCMQPQARWLAFHAIAHVMDWGHRSEIWALAKLEQVTGPKCKYEPGGSER